MKIPTRDRLRVRDHECTCASRRYRKHQRTAEVLILLHYGPCHSLQLIASFRCRIQWGLDVRINKTINQKIKKIFINIMVPSFCWGGEAEETICIPKPDTNINRASKTFTTDHRILIRLILRQCYQLFLWCLSLCISFYTKHGGIISK